MEIEEKIEKLKKERQFLSWLLNQYITRRISGHKSRLEHLKKINQLKIEKVRIYDLYYITSDKLTGEDFLFFNYPDLWIEYKFADVV